MKDISQIDIKRYWQIVIRRRYLFIAVSLFCLSVIVWGSYIMPKTYEAKSTVFIERNVIKNLVQGMVVTPSIEERLRVLTYAMMSRNMLLKVINAMDLDIKAKNQASMESMVKDFQDNTKIMVKGNDLFVVSYKGGNPKIVRDYVNTLVSEYIEENISSKRQEAFGANKFLSDQIDFYKKKIEEAEERLMSFRREKGLTLATDERTLVSSIKQNKDEMENTEVKIKELEAKKAKMKQQLSGEEPFTVAIIDNKEKGGNLSIRLKMLEQKIPMLLTRYTEKYPEVIKTRAEIETIKKQIEAQKQSQGAENASEGDLGSGTSMMNPLYQQLKEDLFRTDSEIDSLKAKIAILNIRLKKSESEVQNIPKEKKDLSDIERDRNTYQKIYEQLLSRLGQSEVSEQMEVQDKGTTFRVVDPAILPTRPVSPNRVLLILIGIVAGAAAGVGAVLLSDYLDNSIRDIDTLKSQLGLQVLAVIPKITTDDDIKKEQRLDRRVYAISLTYLTIIGGIFIREIIVSFLLNR